jgi:hypothetical protein
MNYTQESKISLKFPQQYANKILVIKILRELLGLGLADAKDLCETPGDHVCQFSYGIFYTFPDPAKATEHINDRIRLLRLEGVHVGGAVHFILDDLRDLARKALEQQEDELANEILQLVLAEKLRRNDDVS